jgi:hypothetical protein
MAGAPHAHRGAASLNRSALRATSHCLTGCAIGEVLGWRSPTALDWGPPIALAAVLAFAAVAMPTTARPFR